MNKEYITVEELKEDIEKTAKTINLSLEETKRLFRSGSITLISEKRLDIRDLWAATN